MAKYNGYRNYNQWNVSLWINNDEGLYDLARDCVRRTRNREDAAQSMLDILQECGITHTPDNVRYTVTGIKAGLVGI